MTLYLTPSPDRSTVAAAEDTPQQESAGVKRAQESEAAGLTRQGEPIFSRSSFVWVTRGASAPALGREQGIEHVVAPFLADAQIVPEHAFAAEAELLSQPTRGGVVGVDEGLHAMQGELAEAEIEHRADGLAGQAPPPPGGVDEVARSRHAYCGYGRRDN